MNQSDKDEATSWIAGISLVIGAGLLAAGGDALAGDTGAVVGIVLAFFVFFGWIFAPVFRKRR